MSHSRIFYEYDLETSTKTNYLRRQENSVYLLKDRSDTRIYDNKRSCNPGIIKASAPLPLDERLPKVEYDRWADTWDIDRDMYGYSDSHPQIPYVNSISGSAYGIIIFLQQYRQADENNIFFKKDASYFIHAFLAFSSKNSYHSLAEMTDVFRDEVLQDTLKAATIKLDAFPQDILEQAINKATDYTTVMHLKYYANTFMTNKPILRPVLTQTKVTTALHSYSLFAEQKIARACHRSINDEKELSVSQ